LGQKLLDRECLVSRSIVMVENPIIGPKFWPFCTHSFTLPPHYSHITSSVDSLTLWDEFRVRNALITEQSDHYLHLWFQHPGFLGSWECLQFPLQTLSFAFRITLKVLRFISDDNFWQNFVRLLSRNIGTHISCQSHVSAIWHWNTRLISATTSTQLALVRWNREWCRLKHAQICLYYDQVPWVPLSWGGGGNEIILVTL
jgi:hypothetical protein